MTLGWTLSHALLQHTIYYSIANQKENPGLVDCSTNRDVCSMSRCLSKLRVTDSHFDASA